MDSNILFPRPSDEHLLRAQLEAVITGGNTARFHTLATLRRNTVGQHSYGVAMLCWLLANGDPSKQLLMAALTHDLAEQWVGDVPAPAKRALGMRQQFGQLENNILEKLGMHFPTDGNDTIILKLADAMDGMLFCIHERRMGNTLIDVAYANFYSYAKEQPMGCDQLDVLTMIHNMWSRAL